MEDELENTKEYVIGEIKCLLERATLEQLCIILQLCKRLIG